MSPSLIETFRDPQQVVCFCKSGQQPYHFSVCFHILWIVLSPYIRHSAAELSGKRAVLFSYGSGLAASMFSVRFSDNASPDSALHRLSESLADLQNRLDSRQKVEPSIFSQTMKLREDTHHLGEFEGVKLNQSVFIKIIIKMWATTIGIKCIYGSPCALTFEP